MGFPGGAVVKNLPANAGDVRDMGLIPGLGKSPGGGNGTPSPVFLPAESHGHRGLASYTPSGCRVRYDWASEPLPIHTTNSTQTYRKKKSVLTEQPHHALFLWHFYLLTSRVVTLGDFPGGTVDKNPPANTGDTGLIPGLERFHMPWSNWAQALEPMNLTYWTCTHKGLQPTTPKPECCDYWSPCALEPVLPNKKSHHDEKPAE